MRLLNSPNFLLRKLLLLSGTNRTVPLRRINMAGKKGSKNFGNPSSISYWTIKKGLSEEEAKKEQQKYIKQIREKKIKEFGSEEAYREYRGKNSSFKKENALKRFGGDETKYLEWKQVVGKKGLKISMKEYWINKGYSEEEAQEKVSEHAISSSPRRKEYWLLKGYSEEEAQEKVSEFQDNCSLSSFCQRYGEEMGLLKYESYVSKIKETTIFSNSEFQAEMASKTRYSSTNSYWIKKGFSEEEAEIQRKLYIKAYNPQFPEYYERLGYSIEEAINLSHEFQVKASASRKFLPTSKIEQEIFDWVSENVDSSARKEKIYDCSQRRYFFPDIVTDNFILEVYGDYWHANPNIYENMTVMFNKKLARQVRIDDKKRITRLNTLTGLPVFIVWENDLINLGIEKALKNVLGDKYEDYKKN